MPVSPLSNFNPNMIRDANIVSTADLNTGQITWSVEGGMHDGKVINSHYYPKIKEGEWYFFVLLFG
jgi:hypothetical protein